MMRNPNNDSRRVAVYCVLLCRETVFLNIECAELSGQCRKMLRIGLEAGCRCVFPFAESTSCFVLAREKPFSGTSIERAECLAHELIGAAKGIIKHHKKDDLKKH